mmetsp:Transcript_59078/g.120419  ORF Transcript_59078/g.120419 Transcript_59078/m.120419 type:complete len:145 (+) Transcript_59078:746-1180(+)
MILLIVLKLCSNKYDDWCRVEPVGYRSKQPETCCRVKTTHCRRKITIHEPKAINLMRWVVFRVSFYMDQLMNAEFFGPFETMNFSSTAPLYTIAPFISLLRRKQFSKYVRDFGETRARSIPMKGRDDDDSTGIWYLNFVPTIVN